MKNSRMVYVLSLKRKNHEIQNTTQTLVGISQSTQHFIIGPLELMSAATTLVNLYFNLVYTQKLKYHQYLSIYLCIKLILLIKKLKLMI